MTAASRPDELRHRFDALYTGALTDVLFGMGYGAQGLAPGVQALQPGARVAGPAVLFERRPFVSPVPVDEERVWDVFRAVPPDAVAVYITHSRERAVIGDLAIAFLKVRGCAGIVVDGGVRDVDALAEIGLPVFCRHTTPQDVSHGNGGEFQPVDAVTIGEARIASGDYLVGDADGLVAIPAAVVEEVLTAAEAVVGREVEIRRAILAGESPEEAFRRLG